MSNLVPLHRTTQGHVAIAIDPELAKDPIALRFARNSLYVTGYMTFGITLRNTGVLLWDGVKTFSENGRTFADFRPKFDIEEIPNPSHGLLSFFSGEGGDSAALFLSQAFGLNDFQLFIPYMDYMIGSTVVGYGAKYAGALAIQYFKKIGESTREHLTETAKQHPGLIVDMTQDPRRTNSAAPRHFDSQLINRFKL